MILHDLEQGSDAWKAARCGVVTASNFKKVITKGKGKTRLSYMDQLAYEIASGQPTLHSFQSDAMTRGVELEPRARRAYEALTGHRVNEVGIVYLCQKKRVAASPDGLIGLEGGLEIKCPLPHTHEKYLIDRRLPKSYLPQIQGSLWVTGRKWWDFVSYAPEFETSRQIMHLRIERDEDYISMMAEKVSRFIEDLDTILESRKVKRRA